MCGVRKDGGSGGIDGGCEDDFGADVARGRSFSDDGGWGRNGISASDGEGSGTLFEDQENGSR